jgi:hypothetical protein
MKTALSLCLIFALLVLPAFSYAEEQFTAGRKDPILAGALSWYVPGLGQMYSGAFLKGAAFFVVEEALLLSTVLTFAELKVDVTGGVDIGLNIKSKEHPDRDEQKVGVFLGITFIVVHFINVIDAVNTTIRYNRSQESSFYPEVNYDVQRSAYELELNHRI